MDYIINPNWFYWAEVIDSLKIFFQISTLVFGIVAGAALIVTFIFTSVNMDMPESMQDDTTIPKKVCFVSTIIFVIAFIASIFIPSKKVLTEMLIAENITKSNIEYAEQEIKDMVDYIFDKFDEQKK